MKNNLNIKFLFLFILIGTIAQGQVQTILNNAPAVKGENSFLDASSFNNYDNNTGKGMVFPRTNLTTWTFSTASSNGTAAQPNSFDGMVVYNTGSGSTLSGQGLTVNVTPGFYYFSNPSGTTNIKSGEWKAIAKGNSSRVEGGPQFDFPGTEATTHINFGDNQDTYIRGGFNHSKVILADYSGMNVGIGTQNPTAKLEVYGTFKAQSSEVNDLAVNNSLVINTAGATGSANPIVFNSGNNTQDKRLYLNSGAFEVQSNEGDANKPIFRVNHYGRENVTVLGNGNVGIGTMAPSAKLEVNGTIKAQNLEVNNLTANNTIYKTNTIYLDLQNSDTNSANLTNESFLRVIISNASESGFLSSMIGASGEGIPSANNVGKRVIVKLELNTPLEGGGFDTNYFYSANRPEDLSFDGASNIWEFICMDLGGGNYKYLLLD